jgi:CheY-like chemotaxis protein
MTNKQKPFRMLIGDDSFADRRCIEDSMSAILLGIGNINKVKINEGYLENGIYRCDSFSLSNFKTAEILPVVSVDEMLQEGKKEYDFIATDYSYGADVGGDGLTVLRAIRNNPSPKAMFTSYDNCEYLRSLELEVKECGAHLVCPMLCRSRKGKTELLGEFIRNYFQKIGGKTQ